MCILGLNCGHVRCQEGMWRKCYSVGMKAEPRTTLPWHVKARGQHRTAAQARSDSLLCHVLYSIDYNIMICLSILREHQMFSFSKLLDF